MKKLNIIFAHGRESGPWGTKIRILAALAEKKGCQVISRDDRDTQDPDLRVERMIEHARHLEGPLVLVGSSMGGYVATVASEVLRPVGLFLMAPALGITGYANASPKGCAGTISVIHGWADEVIPFEEVMKFAHRHQAVLHLVPAGHALTEQLTWLKRIFEGFLNDCNSLHDSPGRGRLIAVC